MVSVQGRVFQVSAEKMVDRLKLYTNILQKYI